jgi:hypothetical protein
MLACMEKRRIVKRDAAATDRRSIAKKGKTTTPRRHADSGVALAEV